MDRTESIKDRKMTLLFMVLMVCIRFYGTKGTPAAAAGESQILKKLLESYDKLSSPENGLKPVIVNCSMTPFQILSIDDREQEIAISGGFLMMWYDKRLVWDPQQYGKVYMLVTAGDKIWRPDIGLTSGAENAFDFSAVPNSRLTITFFGLVSWHMVRVFKSACRLKMQNFPFDEQECVLVFSSQTSISRIIDLFPVGNITKDFYKDNNEWTLDRFEAQKDSYDIPSEFLQGSREKMGFSTISVRVYLKRRQGYYWIHIIIPCMLLSILVTLVFVMPPDAGEKISFSVTILLAFTVYQLLLAENLPKTPLEEIPTLSRYLSALIGLSTASVMASILTLSIHHTDPKTKMAASLYNFIFGFLGVLTCNCRKSGKVAATSEKETPRNLDEELKASLSDLRKQVTSDDHSCIDLVDTRELLGTIMDKMSKRRDKSNTNVNEWKKAAAIVDRFFLMTFVAMTVIVTASLLIV